MSEILFLCVRNAGRSQMARALFNEIAREPGLALRAESAESPFGTSVGGQAPSGFRLSPE